MKPRLHLQQCRTSTRQDTRCAAGTSTWPIGLSWKELLWLQANGHHINISSTCHICMICKQAQDLPWHLLVCISEYEIALLVKTKEFPDQNASVFDSHLLQGTAVSSEREDCDLEECDLTCKRLYSRRLALLRNWDSSTVDLLLESSEGRSDIANAARSGFTQDQLQLHLKPEFGTGVTLSGSGQKLQGRYDAEQRLQVDQKQSSPASRPITSMDRLKELQENGHHDSG